MLGLVGKDGIGALYAGPDHVTRTRAVASEFTQEGGISLFTRPASKMKYAGTPLKHTFLIDGIASRGGAAARMKSTMPRHNRLFSAAIVAEKLRMLFEQRGFAGHCGHSLKSIDPGARRATFVKTRLDPAAKAEVKIDLELPCDYLHVILPQRAPGVIRQSGLFRADKWTDQGWVDVDMKTMRCLRYPDVFALGDVAGMPKCKAATSLKWMVPVVVDHLVAALERARGDCGP